MIRSTQSWHIIKISAKSLETLWLRQNFHMKKIRYWTYMNISEFSGKKNNICSRCGTWRWQNVLFEPGKYSWKHVFCCAKIPQRLLSRHVRLLLHGWDRNATKLYHLDVTAKPMFDRNLLVKTMINSGSMWNFQRLESVDISVTLLPGKYPCCNCATIVWIWPFGVSVWEWLSAIHSNHAWMNIWDWHQAVHQLLMKLWKEVLTQKRTSWLKWLEVKETSWDCSYETSKF